jgi:hypothetical protein
MKIGHPKNFWGGVMFAVIGAVFATIAYGVKIGGTVLIPGYSMGIPARMGPAFFPFWLGVILFTLGLIIAIGGLRYKGPEEHFPKFYWKPNFYVLGAVVLFGIILKAVGMIVAGILLVVIACLGSQDFQFKRSLVLGVILSLFCAFVFVFGLKLPIPLCPDVESLQSLAACRG